MKAPDLSSFQLVNPRSAKLLIDAEARRFLAPFVGRERNSGEVASELAIKVKTMSYRVRAFRRAGLLVETKQVPRKGRAVKYYRAAPGFRVPLNVLPFADLFEVFRALDEPPRNLALSSVARSAERGGFGAFELVCYRDTLNRLRLELTVPGGDWQPSDLLNDDMPALLFHWVLLSLAPEQAKALQRDLAEVLGRYQGEADEPTSLLGIVLAPLSNM